MKELSIEEKAKDERIRQFLVHEVMETSDEIMSYHNMNKKDVLTWLGKQGEQKSTDTCDSLNIKGDKKQIKKNLQDNRFRRIFEQKPFKKFKKFSIFKHWTIQDAKDGDVLACNKEILLFKSYSVQGHISIYCWYNEETNNFHSKEVVDTSLAKTNKIYQATIEQRDLLFKKMHEAGYKWDANKKELKKIEQKPA